MLKISKNRLNSSRFNQGFETKLVVKRQSASREFVQLPVLTKHLWMCSVQSSVGGGESSNPRQDVRRSLSRAKVTPKGDDLNVSFCD
jgi:hypothetical protein